MDTKNPDTKMCDICCDDYNKSTRARFNCPVCDYPACRACIRRYLLTKNDLAHCLNCKNQWELDTLTKATLQSFVNGEYKAHRKQMLFEHEKSRLPATMPDVEEYKQVQILEVEMSGLKEQVDDIRAYLQQLQTKRYRIEEKIRRYRSGGTITQKKKKFIKACPTEGCRGFLSTQWRCPMCECHVCSKCFAIKPTNEHMAEHKCDENDVKSADIIRKETRNCPNGHPVFKISGCDQMFCTRCNTAFSWKTGHKVFGVIHNPHFYHWQNNGGGAGAVNAPGAVMCGGLPNVVTFRQTILGILDVSRHEMRNKILSENAYLAKAIIDLHRASTHFTHVELERVRRHCNNAADNKLLRIKYILKKVTEKEMMKELMKRDKRHGKSLAILHVYELINTVFVESLRDVFQSLHDLDTDLDEKAAKKVIVENLSRCNGLRTYANAELKKISVLYSQTVSVLEPDFRTVSRKFKRADLTV